MRQAIPKRSLLYLAVASLTNIVLDILFIAIMVMGVAERRIATDISQAVSCILSVSFLMRVKDSYQVSLKKLKIHRRIAGSMDPGGTAYRVRTWSFPCPTYWCRPVSMALGQLPWQAIRLT